MTAKTKEEKREHFLKVAKENKENFELHLKLILEHITPVIDEHFKPTNEDGNDYLLLALMEYSEAYAQQVILDKLPDKKHIITEQSGYRTMEEERAFHSGAMYVINLLKGGEE